MHKVVEIRPLENYRLWLEFSDGTSGSVDLSGLVGKGVFKIWEDENVFRAAFIDSRTHTVAWEGGIDLCPDNLYAQVTGIDPLASLKMDGKSVIR